ncbi:MAG: alanine:cation symporter family protein [Planctomycetes bacterium]|nr:alanine:cation symporter family protein [Planctomycetota bacterium]
MKKLQFVRSPWFTAIVIFAAIFAFSDASGLSQEPASPGEQPAAGEAASAASETPAEPAAEATPARKKKKPKSWLEENVDSSLGGVVGFLAKVMFMNVLDFLGSEMNEAGDLLDVYGNVIDPKLVAAEKARVEAINETLAEDDEEEKANNFAFVSKWNPKYFDAKGALISTVEADVNHVLGREWKDNVGIESPRANLPLVLFVLIFGGVFFTFFYKFINFRGFKHCIDIIKGKFDDPADEGEVSHFRALTSALSATIGLGNIAGVAIAVSMGGAGAVFWMVVFAFFGMSAKFSCCTLAQMYRKKNEDGSISGGPMYYIPMGFKEWLGEGAGSVGLVLAVLFAVMCIGGSLGGGNMFQANQSFEAFRSAFGETVTIKNDAGVDEQVFTVFGARYDDQHPWPARIFGLVMSAMVGLVVLGGIKRIGAATSKIVPTMCILYVLCCLYIVLSNFSQIPAAFAFIISDAFTGFRGLAGGFVGVLVMGVKRAAFSNEAGIGSAAIAHAAAKTDEPVREGIVAMIGPFIDTVIVCFMTAIVIVITDSHNAKEIVPGADGVSITTHAFATAGSIFPYLLSISIVLFAYSTMISWCYYGERAWMYLAGAKTLYIFRIIFVFFVFFGTIIKLGNVLDFSDLMILGMAFPNIIAMVILAPVVKRKLDEYWNRYTSGKMPTYEEQIVSGQKEQVATTDKPADIYRP